MQILKTFLLGVALALGVATQAQAQPQPALPNFADLVEKHGPAVVNIRTEASAQRTPDSGALRRRPDGRVLPPVHAARPAPGQPGRYGCETRFYPAVDRIGGDSDKLAQVVGNFLENVWHYTPPGGTAPGLHGTLRCGSEDCFLKPGERDFRKRPSLHFRTFLPRRKVALPGSRRRRDRPGNRERAGRSARRAGGRGDRNQEKSASGFPFLSEIINNPIFCQFSGLKRVPEIPPDLPLQREEIVFPL